MFSSLFPRLPRQYRINFLHYCFALFCKQKNCCCPNALKIDVLIRLNKVLALLLVTFSDISIVTFCCLDSQCCVDI